MAALQIRDVPADVREALAHEAATQGQSLQSFLLRLVTAQARRSANLRLLERFDARQDGSQLTTAEVTETLDHVRADREALFGEVTSDAP